jgi:small subunit ribosomal protein S6
MGFLLARSRSSRGFAPETIHTRLRSVDQNVTPIDLSIAVARLHTGLPSVDHFREGHHMPLYEHVFLARQDVSNQQVETLTKEFTDVITEGGGKVTKTEYWGLKGLAYKIKKNRKAHFSLLNIEAPAAAVAEMERRMGIQPDILRFMTVKVEAHETEPSAMMRKQDREERGERGDRGDRGPRGGGFRGGDRGDGGSTFRSRPPREGGSFRDGDAPRGPRPPRPPRSENPGSEG